MQQIEVMLDFTLFQLVSSGILKALRSSFETSVNISSSTRNNITKGLNLRRHATVIISNLVMTLMDIY